MEDKNISEKTEEKQEFKGYAVRRIALGVLLTFAGLWIFGTVVGRFSGSDPGTGPGGGVTAQLGQTGDKGQGIAPGGPEPGTGRATGPAQPPADSGHPVKAADAQTPHPEPSLHGDSGLPQPAGTGPAQAEGHAGPAPADTHGGAAEPVVGLRRPDVGETHASGQTAHAPVASDHGSSAGHEAVPAGDPEHGAAAGRETSADSGSGAHGAQPAGDGAEHGAEAVKGHGEDGNGTGHAAFDPNMPNGVAFIDAAIQPLEHELTQRFWGWRPNDIINFTDNVNNFQLGVLEVTRRTAVALTERISRTGSTAAFDRNLENAMNWFMITADRYWFPSPESKYKEGLKELRVYRGKLIRGAANFYTRADNLIPLLMAFEDLLGSCDENLAKYKEDDGSPVSHFQSDDYFYYAQGVASAMHTILLAVDHDFGEVVASRRGTDMLHHAIESCHHAMEIHPIYITNADLSGILANHRANMAAPISHARFYIGVLIKALST